MTQLLLKTALIELMNEKPFSKITIKDICEQADLNRTTFYLHYNDQFELLSDIESEVQQKTIEYLSNARPSPDAKHMIEVFLSYIRNQADLFRILLLDSDSENFRERFIRNSLENFKVNIPLSCPEDEEPYLLSFLLQGSINMITEWIRRGFDIDPSKLADLIYRTCNRIAP